jgi:phytoene dehydrogenase-like protein
VEGEGDNRRAVGVRLADGEELRADVVLSNADVWMTYNQLVDNEHISDTLAARVDRLRPSLSALSLFMAADIDAEALGLDSGNYWILHNPDVSATYREAEQPDLGDKGPFPGGFLTITTLKDPAKMHAGLHALEAFAFVSYDAFRQWKDSQFGDRPDAYNAFKERLTERMLDTVEGVIPNLRDHLKLCERGTPLTNEFYAAAYRGNLYGQAKLRSQIGPGAPPIQTEINGLFHCGQSTAAHGVLGSLTTGLIAAAKITGGRMEDLLTFQEGGKVVCHPAQEPKATTPAA